MAKPAPVKAAPAEDVPAAPVKSKKRLIIIIVLLLLIAGGGAGWYFTQNHTPEEGLKNAKKVKTAPVLQPKYIPIDEKFTVNLQQEEGDRYLQVGITLKIFDAKLEEAIKTAMPEIRSKLLLLLSSKMPSELVSVTGKQILVQQMIAEIDRILGMPAMPAPVAASAVGATAAATPAPPKTTGVADILFSDFIIQ